MGVVRIGDGYYAASAAPTAPRRWPAASACGASRTRSRRPSTPALISRSCTRVAAQLDGRRGCCPSPPPAPRMPSRTP